MKTEDVTTRRRFFRAAGAALSAPLALASPAAGTEDGEALKARLQHFEDVHAIGELNRRYAQLVNGRARANSGQLFAEPSQPGVDERIRGVTADDFARQDVIVLGDDGHTATARIHCTVRIETPIEASSSLVEMARQQGGGMIRRYEEGVFEGVYVRRSGIWKIKSMTYRSA